MKYETWLEAFNTLDANEKVDIHNNWAYENNPDEVIYDFDDDFFNTFFEGKPLEAVRSCFFGDIKNWGDEFIRFNGYGNLESISQYCVQDYMDEEELFNYPECWESYIDDDGEEDEEEF